MNKSIGGVIVVGQKNGGIFSKKNNKKPVCISENSFLELGLPHDKWTQYNFNQTIIKKIVCSATSIFIWTESDNLFIVSNSSFNHNNLKSLGDNVYSFEFKNFLHSNDIMKDRDIPRIKDIFACYPLKIVQLENDEWIILFQSASELKVRHVTDKLKIIGHGPLSHKFIAIDDKNTFRAWSGQSHNALGEITLSQIAIEKINEIIKKDIRLLTCGGDYSVIVTKDNKMYVEGPNTFNSQNGKETPTLQYEYINTPFETLATIKQVKCGYFHTVVLLENGKVYASGYNILFQCGHLASSENKGFLEFIIPNGLCIKDIGCTSRGTYFITTCKKAYFVGEVVGSDYTTKGKFGNVLAHCLPFNQSNGVEYNEVASGGWHYVVYFKKEKGTKSLIYFENNMKRLSQSISKATVTDLSDTAIITLD